jgi:uncharacterized protein YukE
MREFTVDPSRLLATAAVLDQLAVRLESEDDAVRGAGVTAELAAGNGLAGGEINSFAASWARVIHDLSNALARDASMLHGCAKRYEQEDLDVAQHLRGLASESRP